MKESGAHALLASSAGTVLLVAKGAAYGYDKNNAAKVTMFGGRVESGEDPLAALKRELYEELGLNAGDKTIGKLNVYEKTKEQDGSDVDVHVFVVQGIDPQTVVLREEDPGTGIPDVNEAVIEGTPAELLARPDLTRITRLALEDLVREAGLKISP